MTSKLALVDQDNKSRSNITSQDEKRRSIIVAPSDMKDSSSGNNKDREETEIAAQISIPSDGGWGWIVVTASFWSIFILDGIAMTFGALLKDISRDIQVCDSLTTLINSIAIAIYSIASPVVSAFINRFGFRACIMSGSVICSLSLFISYFAPNFLFLIIFYGIVSGFGFSLINLSASLVVGYYFERLRAIAMSVAMCGASLGVTVMSLVNIRLVNLAGWRSTTLFHSGLFGIIYFLGMTYRPLQSVTVTTTRNDNAEKTRTVTYLPNVANAEEDDAKNNTNANNNITKTKSVSNLQHQTVSNKYPAQDDQDTQQVQPQHSATKIERLFKVVSNSRFPTAAAVVKKEIAESAKAAASCSACYETIAKPKITLTTHGELTEGQLKIVQEIVDNTLESNNKVEITFEAAPIKKRGFFGRLFRWDKHLSQMRPMYRDDAFSSVVASSDGKAGIQYQLTVSRAVAAEDLKERKGVFTMAVTRVLATMLDTSLLQRRSFQLLCLGGFLNNLGYLVPYVFLKDRNKINGIEETHCNLFVSAIGLSNTAGRLILGALAMKIKPLKLYIISCLLAGFSTMLSDLSYAVYYQYCYTFLFGFFIAGVVSLRSMTIVSLYGLQKLTNGTGMILMISGFGTLIGTPLAGVVTSSLGFGIAFKLAGAFLTLGSFVLFLVGFFANKENIKLN